MMGLRTTLTPAAFMGYKSGRGHLGRGRDRLEGWAQKLWGAGLGETHWAMQWLECLAGWGPPKSKLSRPPWRLLPPRLHDYFETAGRAEAGALPSEDELARAARAAEQLRAEAEAELSRAEGGGAEAEPSPAEVEAPPEGGAPLPALEPGELKKVLPGLLALFRTHKDALGEEGVSYLGEQLKAFARAPGSPEEFVRGLREFPSPEARREFSALLDRIAYMSSKKVRRRTHTA